MGIDVLMSGRLWVWWADLCEEMDMSEEDKKEEMAPVIAQQVYALLKMEKIDEATKLSQELDTKT